MATKTKILLLIVGIALVLAISVAPAFAGPGNSTAAHDCPQGAGGVHGECVSDAAHGGGVGGIYHKTE